MGKRELLERVRQSDPLERSLNREQRVADREITAELVLDEPTVDLELPLVNGPLPENLNRTQL